MAGHGADHGSPASQHRGIDGHLATYEGFLKGSIALSLICGYILVALVAFSFMASYNVLVGFAGLIIGVLAVLIDARAGNRWYLSGGVLVVFGLLTAIAVH